MARGKKMKTFGVLSVFLFSLFLIGSSFGGNADALTSISVDTEIRMDVEPIITVSFSTRAAILKASMKPGQLDEIKVGAEIRTNSRTGYKAYLSTDKRRKSATDKKATSLVHINNNTDTIPTLESSVAAGDFPVNHWGYSIDGGANYNGMRASNDVDLADFTTSNSSEMRNMDLYFATKIDSGQAGGFYENTIIVTAVANYAAQTINDIEYMQDINNEIALSMVEDQQYQLKDKRDGKKYWISRLRDGNIWMTQNLDYAVFEDNTNSKLVLGRELSDVWSDFVYPVTYSKYTSNTIYTGYTDNHLSQYDNVVFVRSSGTYSVATTPNLAETDDSARHLLLGTMYPTDLFRFRPYGADFAERSYSEPSVRSDKYDQYILNYSQSVCPRGWRLPTSVEFALLPRQYGAVVNEKNSSSFRNSDAVYPLITKESNQYYEYKAFVVNASTPTYHDIQTAFYYDSNDRGFRVNNNYQNYGYVRCVMRW